MLFLRSLCFRYVENLVGLTYLEENIMIIIIITWA